MYFHLHSQLDAVLDGTRALQAVGKDGNGVMQGETTEIWGLSELHQIYATRDKRWKRVVNILGQMYHDSSLVASKLEGWDSQHNKHPICLYLRRT